MARISNPLCLCLLILCANLIPHLADDIPTPIFVLGDSTADVGTNNYLAGSILKANFSHYGIDFPHSRPTGRFSNGFNSADELAKLFGLKRSPPPFLFLLTLQSHHFKKHLFKGVNFASGGAGLLDSTNLGMTVPLSEQITQFTSVRSNLTAMIGEPATEAMLNSSLFFISIGSNDIFGYFGKQDGTPPDSVIAKMLSAYSQHITALYGLGARKFGIISVPPVGCCPFSRLVQLNYTGNTDCFQPMNDFAQAFHLALDGLLINISSQLPGMKYSLGNTYNMTMDVINMPRNYSIFGTVDTACCGHGTLNAEGPCNRSALLCPDRDKYLFWDLFHPTQDASYLAAQALYYGPSYVSPITFGQLGQDN
ncbi:hypothetical protein C2S52_018261 [Perilla frutescens var. hirtella]|nr:hypothetical protein C2S52_018261 [Perilla frutescens var. hirtella]